VEWGNFIHEGDLNAVSPAADKKDNAGMGAGAPGWRSQRVTSCRKGGQCRHGAAWGTRVEISTCHQLPTGRTMQAWGRGTRVEISTCPAADRKDNAGMG
jgi:hypothetical protein